MHSTYDISIEHTESWPRSRKLEDAFIISFAVGHTETESLKAVWAPMSQRLTPSLWRTSDKASGHGLWYWQAMASLWTGRASAMARKCRHIVDPFRWQLRVVAPCSAF